MDETFVLGKRRVVLTFSDLTIRQGAPANAPGNILVVYTVHVMLVKALRLRYLGHKLPKDVLREAPPMIGELRYEDQPHGKSSMVCLLMPLDGRTEPLVQLHGCRIRIEKRGLLIRGTEHSWLRRQRESYPQALWAWPVPPEAMTIRVVPPTSSVMDDLREAMR